MKHKPEWYAKRRLFLMPGNVPRWVRVYDNGGKTVDRYTVVFTGRYTHKTGGEHWVLGMSESPYHPQGVGMHSSYKHQIDRPTYGHLGRKIRFVDLPRDCQLCVLQDYMPLWDLIPHDPDGPPPSRQEMENYLPIETVIMEGLKSKLEQLRRIHHEPELKIAYSRDYGYFIEAPRDFEAPSDWTCWHTDRQGRKRYSTTVLKNITNEFTESK